MSARKKSVVDVFVAKDRTAGFFFLLALACVTGSYLYVEKFRAAMALRAPVLLVDRAGTLRQTPATSFAGAAAAHEAQTRLLVAHLFNRSSGNLEAPKLSPMLLEGKALEWLTKDLSKGSRRSKSLETLQTVEITSVKMGPAQGTSCRVDAEGVIKRVTTFEGRSETRRTLVKCVCAWRFNPTMKAPSNGARQFPTICYQLIVRETEDNRAATAPSA
jgi:hypothetical protein